MFEVRILEVSATALAAHGLWLTEAVATLGLVLTILGALRWKPEAIPAAIGLYIVSAYWFTASTSFANSAVTVARSLTDTFSGIEPGGGKKDPAELLLLSLATVTFRALGQRLLRDNNNKKETGRWLKFSRLFEARDAAFGCTAATTLSARVERRRAFPLSCAWWRAPIGKSRAFPIGCQWAW
jgi:hypothetical protein